MGLDFEILEEQYNKIAADRQTVEERTDLTDEERAGVLAGFDRALSGIEDGLVALGNNAKDEIQSAITSLEAKVDANEAYIESSEKELEQRKAELEEELAKDEPDQGVIEAKRSQIEALEKRIKNLKTATRKVQKEIKEQNKRLIPLMHRFRDKIFTEKEIADLEKLDRKIQSGKKLAEMQQEKSTIEEPVVEVPVEEEPVVEAPVEEEPVVEAPVEEEPVAEAPVEEEPVVEAPVEEEPVVEVPVEEEPVVVGTGTVNYTYTQAPREEVSRREIVVEPQKLSLKDEFKQLYKKAKNKELEQADFDRLVEITSDPVNYNKLGITTGILRNKSKVLLKAMGEFATTNIYKAVSDAREYFGIETGELGEELISTNNAYSWSGIKSMAGNADIKLASQDVLERVVLKGTEMGAENLTEEQKATYLKAVKHLKNIYGFEDSIAAYSEVKSRRKRERDSWLNQKETPIALAESPEEEPVVEEATKAYVFDEAEYDRYGQEYTDGEYTEPVDTFTSKLQEGVFPPEDVAEQPAVENNEQDKEIETDFEMGIDG